MNEINTAPDSRCGYVGIVGRPNVGKSTLLNRLLGSKISITSRKPQTTRHRILGIHTEQQTQIIYVDTPGLHSQGKQAINQLMNKSVHTAIEDVDAVLFMIEALKWQYDDAQVLKALLQSQQHQAKPIIVLINKVDQIKDKDRLLPFLEEVHGKLQGLKIHTLYPISAKHGDNLPELQAQIATLLPVGPHYFPEEQLTDRSMRFTIAELIREKCFRATGDELPYSITVDIESMQLKKNIHHINALILVERDGQKKILIGEKGEKLKAIGKAARLDMETLLENKVFLQLWVKVKRGWSDDIRALKNLGYDT